MSLQAPIPHASPALPFTVSVRPHREEIHVAPSGELDMATVAELRAAVQELVDAGFDQVVVDLRELAFIDCAGIALLLDLQRAARADGWQLSLIQGRDVVHRVFSLTETVGRLPFQTR